MSSSRLVILMSAEEARLACRRDAEGEVWLASCVEALDEVRRAGREAVWMDEDELAESFGRLNDWAFRRTIDFVAKFRGDARKHRFLQSQFMGVKSAFIQPVKFVLYLEKMVRRHEAVGIAAYGAASKPALSLCREHFRRAFPGLRWEDREALSPAPKPAGPGGGWKKSLFSPALTALTNAAASTRLFFARPGETCFFSGSLRVLESLRPDFGGRFRGLVFVERDFNAEKFAYCSKRRVPYFVLGPGSKATELFSPRDFELPPGEAVFDGVDAGPSFAFLFSEFLKTGHFDPGLGVPFAFSVDEKKLGALYRRLRPRWTLLDEDVAMRRLFAVIAEENGLRSFVVSHGVPGVQAGDGMRSPYSFSSRTFVQSQSEKEAHERIYFDPEKVLVTGRPDYDRVPAIRKAASVKGGPPVVLYCCGSLVDYDFFCLYLPIVGLNNALRHFQETFLRDTVSIFKGRGDASLRLKLHYSEKTLWEELLRRCGAGPDCRILAHSDDILDVLPSADLVITPESTVVREAFFYGKPVVLLNYSKASISNRRYVSDGVVEEVRNADEYRRAVEAFLGDRSRFGAQAAARERLAPYYQGPLDGRAAARVADVLEGAA